MFYVNFLLIIYINYDNIKFNKNICRIKVKEEV